MNLSDLLYSSLSLQGIMGLLYSAVLLGLFNVFRRRAILLWSAVWGALGLYAVNATLAFAISAYGGSAVLRMLASSVSLAALGCYGVLLCLAGRLSVGIALPPLPVIVVRASLFAVLGGLLAVPGTEVAGPQGARLRLLLRLGVPMLALSMVHVVTALRMLRTAHGVAQFGRRVLAASLLAWAAFALLNSAQGLGLTTYRPHPLLQVIELCAIGLTGLATVLLLMDDERNAAVEAATRSANTESQLTRTQGRLLAALQEAPEAIALLDAERRVITHNAAYAEAMQDRFGVRPVNGAVLRTEPDDGQQRWDESVDRALAGETVQFEVEFQGPDGTPRFHEVRLAPATREGRADAVVVLVRDRTAVRRLQAELSSSQRIEGLGRLAGGVAHDFNNLLTAILGNLGLAREALPDHHPALADLEEVRRSADRAAELTRQLLAFARRGVVDPQPIALGPFLGALERLLSRTLESNIGIRVRVAPDCGQVFMDRPQFEQVMMNLAFNARDAMPEGGQLTIRAENETLLADHRPGMPAGAYVRITVEDTGTGMTPEVLERLFEPFFTTKPPGRGTGLGLPMCYGVVKQAHGFIWAHSEPGRGASFTIYLPRHAGVEAPVEGVGAPVEGPVASRLPSPTARGGETILLVDDTAAVRAITERLLVRLGYDVISVEGPVEALALARPGGRHVHLLLTDLVMPGMNGREMASRLQRAWPDLKVLYMSGYTAGALEERGVLEPGLAFIEKPFRSEELATRLRTLLDAPEAG